MFGYIGGYIFYLVLPFMALWGLLEGILIVKIISTIFLIIFCLILLDSPELGISVAYSAVIVITVFTYCFTNIICKVITKFI